MPPRSSTSLPHSWRTRLRAVHLAPIVCHHAGHWGSLHLLFSNLVVPRLPNCLSALSDVRQKQISWAVTPKPGDLFSQERKRGLKGCPSPRSWPRSREAVPLTHFWEISWFGASVRCKFLSGILGSHESILAPVLLHQCSCWGVGWCLRLPLLPFADVPPNTFSFVYLFTDFHIFIPPETLSTNSRRVGTPVHFCVL